MALSLEKQSKKQNFSRIEDGTYPARIAQIIDIGQQKQTDWQTGEVKVYDDGNEVIKPEVFINFEFGTERIEVNGEDKPRWLGRSFIISAHEKSKMYELMQATAPGATSISEALGKACTVTVGSTSTGNAKITGISPMMRGMQVQELENPTTVFDFDEPDMAVWEKIPEWLQGKVKTAENFNGSKLARNLSAQYAAEQEPVTKFDDNSPF